LEVERQWGKEGRGELRLYHTKKKRERGGATVCHSRIVLSSFFLIIASPHQTPHTTPETHSPAFSLGQCTSSSVAISNHRVIFSSLAETPLEESSVACSALNLMRAKNKQVPVRPTQQLCEHQLDKLKLLQIPQRRFIEGSLGLAAHDIHAPKAG